LGLMLLAGLSHVFHGGLNFRRETLLKPGPILFQIGAAGLEAVLILLLHTLRATAARSRRISALPQRHAGGAGQTGQSNDDDFDFHNLLLSWFSTALCRVLLLHAACHDWPA
jgi:hypothetical protein